MISIANDTLKITLHTPDGDKGYYRGTRFDWTGVFSSIGYRGCNYTEPWFETYSPLMHDAVCGPAEEFSPIGLDEPSFLKIGVGVLERMTASSCIRYLIRESVLLRLLMSRWFSDILSRWIPDMGMIMSRRYL